MGKASDWLRQERRRTLGDWVALCPRCGHAQRYFGAPDAGDVEADVTGPCPTCGETLLTRCPACAARVASMFAVECEECSAPLRPATAFGGPIRKAPVGAAQQAAEPAAKGRRRR